MIICSCVCRRACDSKGMVKNELIQQVLCVIVIIHQELPYSSQSLLKYCRFSFSREINSNIKH